jgi:hypothetical protein
MTASTDVSAHTSDTDSDNINHIRFNTQDLDDLDSSYDNEFYPD